MKPTAAARSHSARIRYQAGASFEREFESACRSLGVACTRVPDGCRQLGARQLIRVKTPWDYVISFEGKTALIDTKTVGDGVLPKALIKEHQVHEMLKHSSVGGYVIWFRTADLITFVPAKELLEIMKVPGGVKPTHGKLIGGIRPPNRMNPRVIFT